MPSAEAIHLTLEAIKVAARSGDLGTLARLSSQLDGEIEALQANPPDEDKLMIVRRSATEAATLLEATLRGIAAARARLAEIRAVKNGAGIYGDDGQRLRLTLPARENRHL